MKFARNKLVSFILIATMAITSVCLITGCNSNDKSDSPKEDKTHVEKNVDLTGKSLMIYSGAGMKMPMTKIVDSFNKATGCDANITFGNGAQINSQITTSNKGDLFIAGAATELENLKSKNLITTSEDLVKHIPVIAVPKGNNAGISSIQDLGSAKLVLGDAQATPIGKIANAVLKDAGLLEKANIVARTSTAPEMITALSTGNADAAIVWKENAEGKDGIEIVDADGMDKYIKTIPAASLACSENPEALSAFLDYLNSDEAHNIWTNAGYVVIK